MALPCYADEGATLDLLIKEELAAFNLTIDNDSKQLLKSLIGGNRLASRAELQKLCLYTQDKGKVELEDIQAIVGDASNFAMDEVIDAAATGNLPVMLNRMARLTEAGTPVFVVLGAILRHFQALHKAKADMVANRRSAHAVVDQWRPPVHFKRKPLVTKALEHWTLPKLEQALERLEKANFETRNNAQLATSLANTTLLAIGMQAARRSR
jgi:DNA polymerase-3 subunit delta